MVHNFVSDLFGYCKCFDFCSQKVLHHSFVLCLNLKSLNFWTVDTRAATVGQLTAPRLYSGARTTWSPPVSTV